MRCLPIILTFLFLGCSNLAPQTHNFDHSRNEGYVAFVVNETEYNTPEPTPRLDPDPEKCACKGTGIITHGDGHTTHCPYHYKDDEEDNDTPR